MCKFFIVFIQNDFYKNKTAIETKVQKSNGHWQQFDFCSILQY